MAAEALQATEEEITTEERAPEAWAKVRQWLARQGITLRIV